MYFVSTREEEDCKDLCGGSWGYYWRKEDAVRAVHRNVTDMHETIYPYTIIERLELGLSVLNRIYSLGQSSGSGFDGVMTRWDT